VEADPCCDCHEWCGDTGAESDVYECLFSVADSVSTGDAFQVFTSQETQEGEEEAQTEKSSQ